MIAMVADRVFFQYTEKAKARPNVVFHQFACTAPRAVGRVRTIEYEIENISTTQEVQLDMWGFTSSYIDYPDPGVGLPYPHPLVSGAAPVATPTPRSSEIIYYRPE